MSEKKANPIPQGNYVPAVRHGSLIFTSGMTPRLNGVLLMSGKIAPDAAIETYRGAVRQAVSNTLTAARNLLSDGEQIERVIAMTVYVHAQQGFLGHSKIADLASDYLVEELGQSGVGARAAVGMATLPGDAPVEIQLTVAVR